MLLEHTLILQVGSSPGGLLWVPLHMFPYRGAGEAVWCWNRSNWTCASDFAGAVEVGLRRQIEAQKEDRILVMLLPLIPYPSSSCSTNSGIEGGGRGACLPE